MLAKRDVYWVKLQGSLPSSIEGRVVAKIGDCLKEAEETQYGLELMIAEEIVPENKLDKLVAEANEPVAIFVSSMNTAKSNATS